MSLDDLLAPGGVMCGLRPGSKKQLLQDIAAQAEATLEKSGVAVNQRMLFERLLERERLGATGVGEGVAIPHARLPGLDRMTALFARLARPVDFEAVDDSPVDLVFLLLAPETARAEHLKSLARISRLMRDPQMRQKLRGAADAAAIYALLTETLAKAA